MSADLRYASVRWRAGTEWLTWVGVGAPLLLVPPLFEEMNRCRAILIGMGRALAARGHALLLPDLPGTGESSRRLPEVEWSEWRDYLAWLAQEEQVVATLSVRAGTLLQPESSRAWRLSPADGGRITRDLIRAKRAAGAKDTSEAINMAARATSTEFAGYMLSASIYAGLADATVAQKGSRTVRLRGEAASADRVIDAAPPWRTAEPRRDPTLSQSLADDICEWLAT